MVDTNSKEINIYKATSVASINLGYNSRLLNEYWNVIGLRSSMSEDIHNILYIEDIKNTSFQMKRNNLNKGSSVRIPQLFNDDWHTVSISEALLYKEFIQTMNKLFEEIKAVSPFYGEKLVFSAENIKKLKEIDCLYSISYTTKLNRDNINILKNNLDSLEGETGFMYVHRSFDHDGVEREGKFSTIQDVTFFITLGDEIIPVHPSETGMGWTGLRGWTPMTIKGEDLWFKWLEAWDINYLKYLNHEIPKIIIHDIGEIDVMRVNKKGDLVY